MLFCEFVGHASSLMIRTISAATTTAARMTVRSRRMI